MPISGSMTPVRRLLGMMLVPSALLVCVTIALWQQAGS
jgi:hypothetical protein